MAENKNSFLLYRDIIHTVRKLSDENAGQLFKHILSYVNDENPITENELVDLVFEPIKQTLKRDLKRYESIVEKRILAGKASAESRKQNQQVLTSVESMQQSSTNSTVSVSDSVSVIDSVIVSKEIYISKIQKEFYESLKIFTSEFTTKILREFYEYWSEPNKSNTKIKWQLEKTWDTKKRLIRWSNNKFNSNEKTSTFNRSDKNSETIRAAKDLFERIEEDTRKTSNNTE